MRYLFDFSTAFIAANGLPPLNSKSENLGKKVFHQKVEAYPGQDAEFRPAELMYQFEQPAENTDPSSSLSILVIHLTSASFLTSILVARPSKIG